MEYVDLATAMVFLAATAPRPRHCPESSRPGFVDTGVMAALCFAFAEIVLPWDLQKPGCMEFTFDLRYFSVYVCIQVAK